MPGPILTISPLRQADAAVLGPLHVQLWQAAYTGLLPQARLDGIDPERRTRI